MKYLKLFILLLLISTIGQSQTATELFNDSLTADQCENLNTKFEKERHGKDFCEMKVAFFSSPGGSVQQMSSDFFRNSTSIPSTIFFFEPSDKQKHGYDCMIIYESKTAPIKSNNRRLKKLKRKIDNN